MNTFNSTLCSTAFAASLNSTYTFTENPHHNQRLNTFSWRISTTHSIPSFRITNPRNANPPSSSSSSSFRISSYLRRPRLNPKQKPTKKKQPSDPRLEMVIDLEDVAHRASSSLRRFYNASEARLNRFVSSGVEAYDDLRTLVTVDREQRVVIGCRRSSLQFFGNLIVWGLVIVVAFRVLVGSGFLGFRGGFGGSFLWRRDRSLGGREVVVGRSSSRFEKRGGKRNDFGSRVPMNPLSPARDTMANVSAKAALPHRKRAASVEKLPDWWPDVLPSSPNSMTDEESQKVANAAIRAILNNRMSGWDITEDAIIQFRRICRKSGARVIIETANSRDSFYRASVDLVLNACNRSYESCSVLHIDGEDARHFLAGLAYNIGLESHRAVRIVSAAVAARTRSWFLQAWALEMQSKRNEADKELSKICFMHRTFPPGDSSPEMEMVAGGLKKHLRLEQREFLLDHYVEICGAESQRSAGEALGLHDSPKYTVHKREAELL